MALLICILTFWVLLGQCSDMEHIACQSEDDYYRLLYRICIQSSPCKHLFHLYPLLDTASNEKIPETTAFTEYRNQRDFDLFTHQLSRSLIFRIHNADVVIQDERRLVLQNLVPEAWLSEIDVHIAKSGTACSEGEIRPNHAIHALYAMHLYKITVSDEFFCRDPNERFLLDPETDTDYCLCKKKKSCHNDSNFDHYLTIFMPILVFALLIFAFAIIANLFYTRHLLHQL